MKQWRQFEKDTIEMLAGEIEKLELQYRLFEPEEQMPVQVLGILLEYLGEEEQSVKLEICFLPLEEEKREDAGFNYVQFFAVIRDDIGAEAEEDVLKLANLLNTLLPVGNVALGENGRILYMKYCFPLFQDMEEALTMQMLDTVLATFIHTLDTYIDAMTWVADGRLGAEDAIRSGIPVKGGKER